MKLIPITSIRQAAFVSRCYCSHDIQGPFQITVCISGELLLQRLSHDRQLLLVEHLHQSIGYAYADYVRRFDHYELGVTILPEYRGMGLGKQAHSDLMRHLFEHCGATRLQALVSSKNLVEQGVLESLGFIVEGTMIGAGKIDGQHHDILLYAINTQSRWVQG